MNRKTRSLISRVFLCGVGLIAGLAGCSDSTPTAGVTALEATSRPPISPGVTTQPPPGTLSVLMDTPLPSASPSPSRTWPPISSGTGESICFLTPKPPQPFSTWPEEKAVLQCVPVEGNTVHLEQPVALGEFRVGGYDTIFSLEASPNGQWLVVTIGTEGPIFNYVFEMTAGQEIEIEPNGSWYSRLLGWGLDDETAILSKTYDVIFFDMLDQHTEVESLPSEPFGADLAPDGQRFVYAQLDAFGPGALYIEERGSNEPPLSLIDPEADLFHPSWSPARNIIAYLRAPDFSGGIGELWVTDDLLKSPHKLSDLATGHFWAEYTPRWSPDGRWLAFVVLDNPQQAADDLAVKRTGNIYIADSLSGKVRALTNFTGVWTDWPSWSPDGRWIIFSKVENDVSDLWMVEVATGRLQQVTSGLNARHPAWVAHGVPVLPMPTPTLTMTPSRTPPPTRTPIGTLTPTPLPVLGPFTTTQTTTADGRPITAYHFTEAYFAGVLWGQEVFLEQTFTPGGIPMRLLSIDLAKPDAISQVVAEDYMTGTAHLASGAHRLVYATTDTNAQLTLNWPLYSLDLDSRETVFIGVTIGSPYRALFSVADATGEILLIEDDQWVIAHPDGAQRRTLDAVQSLWGTPWSTVDFSQGSIPLDVALSPDGRQIAISSDRLIRIATVDGQTLLEVQPGPVIENIAGWSPDGKRLAVRETWEKTTVFEVFDVPAGSSFRLEPPEHDMAIKLAWSPHANQIAFTFDGNLYLTDDQGLKIRGLDEVASEYSLAWSGDGKAVFYICKNNDLGNYSALCAMLVPPLGE